MESLKSEQEDGMLHYDSMQEGQRFLQSPFEKEVFEEDHFNKTYLVERLVRPSAPLVNSLTKRLVEAAAGTFPVLTRSETKWTNLSATFGLPLQIYAPLWL